MDKRTKAYHEFLRTKRFDIAPSGFDIEVADVNPLLFDFQKALVKWAVKRGRCAIFADTGLGKTMMQLEWARLIGQTTLIVAPLSVARQTVREATKLGLEIVYSRGGQPTTTITITNYEMVQHFNPSDFGAVVLDESSILKSLDGKTRKLLTEMFIGVPYRLCCTATPAPNDIVELGMHSQFLGVMSRADMLASFFVHAQDEKDKRTNGKQSTDSWRLKSHARRPFFKWLAQWGMSVRHPSDIGFDDDGYILPPLNIIPQWVDFEYTPEGQLFNTGLKGIQDRHNVRRGSLSDRVALAAELVNDSPDDQWIVWVGLNEEEQAMKQAIPDALVITGSDKPEVKAQGIEDFQDGKYRVLITKSSIAGFGINLQNCANQIFMGMNDSYESYYQSVRRSYRFGQKQPVNIYIVLSHVESVILENVKRKETEAKNMSDELINEVQADQMAELEGASDNFEYTTEDKTTDRYRIMLGDSCERIREIASDTVGLSIFSPPFMSLYTYSPTERDLGNSRSAEQFFEHFQIIIEELLRVTKPGRNCCVHVAQVPATKVYDGYIGLKDFRGDVIRQFIDKGWVYYGEVCIDKDPQAQAIRTKSRGLLFASMERDSLMLRPALADYILIFNKPGDNETPVKPLDNGEATKDDWISWARPIWYGIKETETLNTRVAKETPDEKHVAPLQLEVIRRLVILFSNPDELVFDPFGGLGSTGYVAVKNKRRAVMCELKPSYYRQMQKHMALAADEGSYQTALPLFADTLWQD
jgi:DNA modification methylase